VPRIVAITLHVCKLEIPERIRGAGLGYYIGFGRVEPTAEVGIESGQNLKSRTCCCFVTLRIRVFLQSSITILKEYGVNLCRPSVLLRTASARSSIRPRPRQTRSGLSAQKRKKLTASSKTALFSWTT
jgi:hypothetical protein